MRIVGNDPELSRQIMATADGAISAAGKPVIVNADGTASQVSGSATLTSENYIGTSEHAAADGAKVLVNTQGAVDENQSGLTAGQTYYVQADGTFGTSADSPSVIAGTALSASKLLVKG